MLMVLRVDNTRCMSRQMSHFSHISSIEIRKRFLDYFVVENFHKFIRSSSVVPYHDGTLAFVNAGMNQFKDVLLNKTPAPCSKAANSQKCIRVGGKHNDLKSVGLDGYHHTFFEMLGNWSFGEYFKQGACELAWKLLTTPPYSISPGRLYVTYFGGCSELNLPPDLEIKEIWKSLGVQHDHIIEFGVNDNFWEMGKTGPCGACTEIHVDHIGAGQAAHRVNKGYSDVTELWNLVFIEYNRNEDGSLSPLPCRHVDTGMGFERLVALLQNKKSNYDTDLFLPLFDNISKVSKVIPYSGVYGSGDMAKLDTAYRVLADHTRMVTVAVADNMFPDHNHKLRRVIRKALLVAKDSFKANNAAKLMKEVSNSVAEVLSHTYTEIGANLSKVHLVIDHEWELLKGLQGDAIVAWQSLVQQDTRLAQLQLTGYEATGLCAAYKELVMAKGVTGELAFHLYDTYGLHQDFIQELATALGYEFCEDEFNAKLEDAKKRTLQSVQGNKFESLSSSSLEKLRQTVPITDDSAKYNYSRTVESDGQVRYEFPIVQSVIKAVIKGGDIVNEGKAGERVGLVLNRTSMYHEAGGQQADRGQVEGQGWSLDCECVINCGGYILHIGNLKETTRSSAIVTEGARVVVKVDNVRRLACMRNHTATHCLNAVLHQMFTVTRQMGSSVNEQHLIFDFATYGQIVTKNQIAEIENKIMQVVQTGCPVTRSTVSSSELMAMEDVTLLPGETYPSSGIHIIQIQGEDFTSKEACCGTHVINTRDLEDFCVCVFRSHGSGAKSVTAVTGPAAHQARLNGQQALANIRALKQQITSQTTLGTKNKSKIENYNRTLQYMKNQVTEDLIPYAVKTEALEELNSATKLLKDSARSSLRMSVDEEIKNVLQTVNADGKCRFLVHCLSSTSPLDKVPLLKVTKMCPAHLPVIIFAYTENQLKARCCVPMEKLSSSVSAELWMQPVLTAINGSGSAPKGQDPRLIFNMKSLYVHPQNFQEIIDKALNAATQEAVKLFS